jgi:hypothetical protein
MLVSGLSKREETQVNSDAVPWAGVEAEFKAAGKAVRLGVPAAQLPPDDAAGADHAVLLQGGRPAPGGVGFSPYDLMFFEALAKVYRPRRIALGSDDFGWNAACLRALFAGSEVVEFASGADADFVLLSGARDTAAMREILGQLGSGGAPVPTVLIWNAARDRHWSAFNAAVETWNGPSVQLWRTSGCAGLLAGGDFSGEALAVARCFAGAGPWEPEGPVASGPEAPVFQRLTSLYRAQGYDVMVGIENRNHDLRKDTELATLFTGDPARPNYRDIGQGIAVSELYFFECLARVFHPRDIFIVGSGFGWSTLGLALMFPDARVVAIDNMSLGEDVGMGIELTRRIASAEGLNVTVVEGASPEDVPRAVNDHLSGGIDLAFIDGLDTDEQQALDFRAVSAFLHDPGVIAFHHVLLLKLLRGFREIEAGWTGGGGVMTRTPSGMGCLYTRGLEDTVGRIVDAFSDPSVSPSAQG